ncbi:hypothetical protein [Myroides injenensis]|uniref:hypothetical protein n=1 Tax=Myroides injenensis TaxID=1183151 RepID=UPI00028A2A70|nr:hypothetical protein [Myroides injenensis]
MRQLLTILQDKKEYYKGNSKELEKLLNKLESFSHAPTTDKHAARMQIFADSPELTSFINQELKDYYTSNNDFKKDEYGYSDYDIITSWYLFTLLVLSPKVESTVTYIIRNMIASQNYNLYIIRRIFHLCSNPVYEKQMIEVEEYFQNLHNKTAIYKWLNELKVIPPTHYNWEFNCQIATDNEKVTDSIFNNLQLTIKGFEPLGDGESFELEITNRQNIKGRWNDFSSQDYFYYDDQKIQLRKIPNVLSLKEFISELEEIFQIKFNKKLEYSYFSKGFKKKENIQKWLLE